MERTYRQENNTYLACAAAADFNTIGVEIPTTALFTYVVAAGAAGIATSFTATATANLDDDATIDTWTIDDTGNLQNTINDVTG